MVTAAFLFGLIMQYWSKCNCFHQHLYNPRSDLTSEKFIELFDMIVSESKPFEVFFIRNSSRGAQESKLLKSIKIPYIVMDSTIPIRRKIVNPPIFPDNFIAIISTDATDYIEPIVERSLLSRLIVNRTRILVSIYSRIDKLSVEKVFHNLWRIHVVNINILHSMSAKLNPQLLTYNPYSEKFIIDMLRMPIEVKSTSLFPDKCKNLYGKPIRIFLMEMIPNFQKVFWNGKWLWIGDSAEMLEPLKLYYNASLAITIKENFSLGFEIILNENESKLQPGVGMDVHFGNADFILKRISVNYSLYFDFIYPVEQNNYPCLIPKAGRWPQYLVMYFAVSDWTKFFILISMLATIVFIRIAHIMFKSRMNFAEIVLKITSVLLSQPPCYESRTDSIRLLLTSWQLLCLCVITIFTSRIMTTLVSPVFYEDIDDPVHYYSETNYKIFTFDDLAKMLLENNPGTESFQKILKSRLVGLSRAEFYRKALHPGGHDSFIVYEELSNWIMRKTKYVNGQYPAFHKTNPSFYTMSGYYVARGSPLYHTLNNFHIWSFEAGLKMHWEETESWYHIQTDHSRPRDIVLNLEHVQAAFILYSFGIGISILAFAIESLMFKYKKI